MVIYRTLYFYFPAALLEINGGSTGTGSVNSNAVGVAETDDTAAKGDAYYNHAATGTVVEGGVEADINATDVNGVTCKFQSHAHKFQWGGGGGGGSKRPSQCG